MFIDIHAHAYRTPVPFVTQFPTMAAVLRDVAGQHDRCQDVVAGCRAGRGM